MPKNIFTRLWATLLCAFILSSLALTANAAPPNPSRWRLIFQDEFNGSTLDKTKWNTTYWWGGRTNTGNKELQWYMDDAFEFQNGVLKIRADKRTVDGFNYTSGMLSSHNKFSTQYGYFEIRAKVPKGKGFWPAFWMLSTANTWPPEIDVLEVIGTATNQNFMTNHFTLNGTYTGNTGVYAGPDLSAGFHTYAVDWSRQRIIWYVDGVKRHEVTTHVPKVPMYVLANLAVGGNWPGAPDANTLFPNYYEIDYIRVYKKKY